MSGVLLFGVLSFALMVSRPGQAQTYTVLHSFTAAADGATPYAGVSMDAHGNLYGTTTVGGAGYGTVFELTLGPLVELNPTSLDFGQVLLEHHKSLPITLTNAGLGTLHITDIMITDLFDFSQTNNCPGSLGAGEKCTITVTFRPNANGEFTAYLSITDNAPGSPQRVRVYGEGGNGNCADNDCGHGIGCPQGCYCGHSGRCVKESEGLVNEWFHDPVLAASFGCKTPAPPWQLPTR
jgi:hypothetical protein